jgi:glycosyltransferase involved in cell wall biosynthesis
MEQIRVSVIVPTRNRPDQIGPCVESILANSQPSLELIVVDQSDARDSESALDAFRHDSRLCYVVSSTRGAARARNVGVEASTADLIAFTDDDCRVPTDWVARIVELFDNEPTAGVIFGRVEIPKNALEGGFLASFEPVRRSYEGEFPSGLDPWGISANMAVRRKVVQDIGAFDPLLGPGSKFKAGEDVDFAIRAIARRWKVVTANEISLLHLGVRTGKAARALLLGYMFATGAVFTKHLRLRTPGSIALVAGFLGLQLSTVASSLMRGTRPTGIRQFLTLLSGAGQSVSHAIDRNQHVYVTGSSEASGAVRAMQVAKSSDEGSLV